jgi:hypothetical protein
METRSALRLGSFPGFSARHAAAAALLLVGSCASSGAARPGPAAVTAGPERTVAADARHGLPSPTGEFDEEKTEARFGFATAKARKEAKAAKLRAERDRHDLDVVDGPSPAKPAAGATGKPAEKPGDKASTGSGDGCHCHGGTNASGEASANTED